MKSLQELEDEVIKICKMRNWQNNDPNQLISSILIELGELAEHYQWQNDFSKIEGLSEEEKEVLGFEFVDVLFYLLRLAHRSNIDIEKYFYRKLPRIKTKKYESSYRP